MSIADFRLSIVPVALALALLAPSGTSGETRKKSARKEEKKKEQSPQLGTSLRIMTANVPFFRYRIAAKRFKTRPRKRLERLISRIKKMNPRPDVIALQEIWKNLYKRKIARDLKRLYPFSYQDRSRGKYLVGMNSGLMILSRFRIERGVRHAYKKFAGFEKIVKKGIIGAQIALPGGKRIVVFVTHLQAGDAKRVKNPHEIKLAQLREAKTVIDRFTRNLTTGTVFLAGDFNLSPQQTKSHYEQAKALFPGMTDTWNPAKGPGSSTQKAVAGKEEPRKLDLIWVLNGRVEGCSYVIPDLTADISDHLAGLGSFSVRSFR